MIKLKDNECAYKRDENGIVYKLSRNHSRVLNLRYITKRIAGRTVLVGIRIALQTMIIE